MTRTKQTKHKSQEMSRKTVEPDDLPSWNLPEVFTWASDMSLQKCRSPQFTAAGEQWMVVRSTSQDHQKRPQLTLSLMSQAPVAATPYHNAVQLRMLLVNPASPGASLVREKVFPLAKPMSCSLASYLLLEEVMDPAAGWLVAGALQVRAAVRTLNVDLPPPAAIPHALPAAQLLQDVAQMGEEESNGMNGGALPGPSVAGDAVDQSAGNRKRQRKENAADRNNRATIVGNPLALAPLQLCPDNGAFAAQPAQPAQPAQAVLQAPPRPAPAVPSPPPKDQDAVVRSACISTLYPLVKRLLPHNGLSRAELWEAVSQRLTVPEAQMITDVGMGLLHDEWRGGSGDPQACIALMRAMLRVPPKVELKEEPNPQEDIPKEVPPVVAPTNGA